MANPTSYRNFAPQHSKKMVAPRICNIFAMGNIGAQASDESEVDKISASFSQYVVRELVMWWLLLEKQIPT
jgi:hypothetical protein